MAFEGEGLVDDLVVNSGEPSFIYGTVIMLALAEDNGQSARGTQRRNAQRPTPNGAKVVNSLGLRVFEVFDPSAQVFCHSFPQDHDAPGARSAQTCASPIAAFCYHFDTLKQLMDQVGRLRGLEQCRGGFNVQKEAVTS
ncbi:MAG: hypothetical protein WCK89_02480 [bacterium]